MTTITSFINRLAKIGIHIELWSNYPWVYMEKVNSRQVKGNFQGNHGFTVFFRGKPDVITDIPIIFNKIRETLNETKTA